jgi:membrane associated rhomboid family serine protease
MGIQDRDYYRDGSNSFLDAWGRQGVIVWLIVITTVVFFAQVFTGKPPAGPLDSELTLVGEFNLKEVLAGEVWRLVTPIFLHASLWHLFFNMLVLFWAGTRIEEIYGSRETASFYVVGGVFAQFIYMLSQLLMPAQAGPGPAQDAPASLGASGAVMAVLVLFAIHYPYQRVLLFWLIPVPAWLLVVLFVVMDTLGAFGAGSNGIGYFAHLGGALFAFLYYQSNFRFSRLFPHFSRTAIRRRRPTLRILPVEPEEESAEPVGAAVEKQPRTKESVDEYLEAKIDQVLEKVSRHGQESLTPEEREILVKASELYKKRRK